MKRIVLAVMVLVFLAGTANAQRTERDQLCWEVFKEIAIRKAFDSKNPVDPWALTEEIMKVRDRLVNSYPIKNGELFAKADDDSVIMITGSLKFKITKYRSEGGIYEVVIYCDGDFFGRNHFSYEYSLYDVRGFNYHYGGETLETSAKGITDNIRKKLGWGEDIDTSLLLETVKKALNKLK